MVSRDSDKSRKSSRKPALTAVIIGGLLLLLALLLRNCFGLGTGDGDGESSTPEVQPVMVAESDAGPPSGSDAGVGVRACELVIDGQGLRVDGQPTDVEKATDICRRAGQANLKAAGDARTGTYLELLRALDTAGVPVREHRWPKGVPPATQDPAPAPAPEPVPAANPATSAPTSSSGSPPAATPQAPAATVSTEEGP